MTTPPFPLQEFLGFTITEPEAGRAVAAVPPSDRLVNPHGVVHGAVLFALVDTGMGAATYSVIPPDCRCASIEVQLRFLAPAPADEPLRADVRVVKAGRRIVHLEARVGSGPEDRLVATATGSFAVLPGPR